MTFQWSIRLALIILSTAMVQVGLFSQLPIAGVRPVMPLLLATAGGVALGPERGAIVGFASGLTFDLLLTTPIGLCALVFCLAGYWTGRWQPTADTLRWWRAPTVVAGASAATYVVLLLLGWLIGQRNMVPDRLLVTLAVVAGVNAVLAPFAVRSLRWALAQPMHRVPLGNIHGR